MPIPFAQIALAAAPLIGRAFGRKRRRPDIDKIIRDFLASRPEGYLSAEDSAFGERQLARAGEFTGGAVREGVAHTRRRFSARGISGPAEEQSVRDIEQGGSLARTAAARDVSDMLHRQRLSNQGFERQKVFSAFGGRLGAAQQEMQAQDADSAFYWNSMMEYLPNLMGLGVPNATTGGAGAPAGPGGGGAPRNRDWQGVGG